MRISSLTSLLFAVLFFAPFSFSQAQEGSNIAVGSWRLHLPFESMDHVAVTPQRVYAMSALGSLFYLEKEDNSLQMLTVLDGLSSVEYSNIAYHPQSGFIVIGYGDGNIDLLKENELYNVNDIVRSATIIGSKKINAIYCSGNLAFICADFGVTVLNMDTRLIQETWKDLSPASMPNPVYSATLSDDKDSIFLATQNGFLCGKYNPGVNLMDYANWYLYTQGTNNIPTSNAVAVASLNGTIYAAVNNDGIYALGGTQWTLTTIPGGAAAKVRSLKKSGTRLLACINQYIYDISGFNTFTTIDHGTSYEPSEALYDGSTIWIADLKMKLVQKKTSGLNSFYMNGPFRNTHFKLHYFNNQIISTSGGYDNTFAPNYFNYGYYQFQDNDHWYNYFFFYGETFDIVDAQYNAFTDKTYLASYGQGLYERVGNGGYNFYNDGNSDLEVSQSGGVRVSGLAVDSKGTLWLSNHYVTANSLHAINTSGTWTSYNLSQSGSEFPLDIEIDSKDNKWIVLGNANGLLAFNEVGLQEKHFSTSDGNLPSPSVYQVAVDKDGHLWAATGKGVAVLYDASSVFSSNKEFITPYYDGFPLLFDREIYCVEIDGANRKWFGTDNGVWLMDESASKILKYFNTTNSPIVSDKILDIEIHDLTGEVFFVTDKGLISYRGNATEGEEDFTTVNVFPNPVKPGYSGMLSINGLAENCIVKITDVSGKLIFEDRANGGMFTWNLHDYHGIKARSGMYIVYASSEDGEVTYVTKFAVLE